jgi:hypothetical protein
MFDFSLTHPLPPPSPFHSYAALGVAARPDPATLAARAAAQKGRREAERVGMKTALRGNVNRNLPRNVPY